MGMYRKWASSFLECPKEQQTTGLKIVQNFYLLEKCLELFCKTILLKKIVELQNNCIIAIIELCDFVEKFCSKLWYILQNCRNNIFWIVHFLDCHPLVCEAQS
jgi:hypothetical protein